MQPFVDMVIPAEDLANLADNVQKEDLSLFLLHYRFLLP